MSLVHAVPLEGQPLPRLQGEPPWPCQQLAVWQGRRFWMPPGDPRLDPLFRGGAAPSPPLENLVGAARHWQERPEWMDFLDPHSPAHGYKLLERDLYLHHWQAHLEGRRFLDLGGGIGRFTQWLLARGAEVELVDPDLRSLWRAVSHVAGGPGRLDVHWTTAEHLPALPEVDTVVAAEVLCYAEDPGRIVAAVYDLLPRGGHFLMSVEARYGWAAALDAPPGCLNALFGDGIVAVPGDRWVRTWQADDLRELLSHFEILALVPTHYLSGGPLELAGGVTALEPLLAWEERCRAHPLISAWNRAWTVVARKPRQHRPRGAG